MRTICPDSVTSLLYLHSSSPSPLSLLCVLQPSVALPPRQNIRGPARRLRGPPLEAEVAARVPGALQATAGHGGREGRG